MAAAVHPHFCIVELPYHSPEEKPTGDALVSYHDQGDNSAVDTLPIPSHGPGENSAANAVGVRHEDPINHSVDNIPPTLCYDRGGNSAGSVSVEGSFAVPSHGPVHRPAENPALFPRQNSKDQSALGASVVPIHDPSCQAADATHLLRYLIPRDQAAKDISVTPTPVSEDKVADNTSFHDPEHQPAEDVLVISGRAPEGPPGKEALQTWDNVSENKSVDADHLALFHDLETQAPGQEFIISHHESELKSVEDASTAPTEKPGDKLKDDAFQAFHQNPGQVSKHDKEEKSAANAYVDSSHDSEQRLAEKIVVQDESEQKSAEQVLVVSDHDIRDKGEDETPLATEKGLEDDHPDQDLVSSYDSGYKQAKQALLSSGHDSVNQRVGDALLVLSDESEVQTPNKALFSPSNDPSGQPADDALLISSHGLEDQSADDALLILSNDLNNQPAEELLVVSPYSHPSHLLRLHTVSKPNQLLAKALTKMKAVRADYATASYKESFNWSTVVDTLEDLSLKEAYEWQPEFFFIVVFRSRIKTVTDRVDLGLMDAEAHEEAMQSGGLLKYWFGIPDANGRNLATCKLARKPLPGEAHLMDLGIWRNQDDAKRGGRGKGHQRAIRAIAGLYNEWKVERLRFVIEPGKHGDLTWDIIDW